MRNQFKTLLIVSLLLSYVVDTKAFSQPPDNSKAQQTTIAMQCVDVQTIKINYYEEAARNLYNCSDNISVDLLRDRTICGLGYSEGIFVSNRSPDWLHYLRYSSINYNIRDNTTLYRKRNINNIYIKYFRVQLVDIDDGYKC